MWRYSQYNYAGDHFHHLRAELLVLLSSLVTAFGVVAYIWNESLGEVPMLVLLLEELGHVYFLYSGAW